MVVSHHTLASARQWHGITGIVIDFARYGNAGVDLFFVLSGFLITSLLYKDRYSASYWHDFYWKRVLRILPLYLVAIGIMIALGAQVGYVVLCVFFMANFANLFHLFPAGPFWSLAIEEQFYLIWPTVVRRRTLTQLRICAMFVAFAAILLRFALAFLGHENYVLTFLRCDGLAFGALLACEYAAGEEDEGQERSRKGLSRIRNPLWLLLFAGVLLLAATKQFSPGFQQRVLFAPVSQTGIVLVTGSFVGLVINASGSPWGALLRSRFLTFFGLISYALYMLHAYALDLYDHLVSPPEEGNATNFWMRIAAVLALSVALSLVSRYIVELPAMSLRKFVLRRPTGTGRWE